MTDSTRTSDPSDWSPGAIVFSIKKYWSQMYRSGEWKAFTRANADRCFVSTLKGLQKLKASGVQKPSSILINKTGSIVVEFPRHNVCLSCGNTDRWTLTTKDFVKLDDVRINDPECLERLALVLSDQGADLLYTKSKSCEKIIRIVDIVTHTRTTGHWSVSLCNGSVDCPLKDDRVVVRVYRHARKEEKYDHIVFKSRGFSTFWSVKYLDRKLGVTSRGLYDTESEEDMQALGDALKIFPIVFG